MTQDSRATVMAGNRWIKSRTHFWVGLLALAGLTAGMVVLALFPVAGNKIVPECMFHRVTGLYCSGCGGTRCLAALARGELRQAAAYNAAALFLWLPVFLAWMVHNLYKGLTARPLIPWRALTWWSIGVFLALMLLFMVARNIPAYPLKLLAPHELNPTVSPATQKAELPSTRRGETERRHPPAPTKSKK